MRQRRRQQWSLLPLVLPLALLGAAGTTLTAHEASASVAFAASLEDLARAATVIARVTPVERSSVWESGRIVTRTRVRIDNVVAGPTTAPGAGREIRIRTLGGNVGNIGQLVEGEASFGSDGTSSLLFLAPFGGATSETFAVVGRAQGQLLVRRDGHGREVVRVGDVGKLVERFVPAPLRAAGRPITDLDGAPLETLAIDAKRAWEKARAK